MKKGGVEWDEKISGWFFNGDISSEIMGDAWLIYGGFVSDAGDFRDNIGGFD